MDTSEKFSAFLNLLSPDQLQEVHGLLSIMKRLQDQGKTLVMVDDVKASETETGMQVFNNPEFGEVRTIIENGKVLFCGRDVATALGYTDTINALKQHCRWVVKRHLPHPQNPDKKIEMSFIPEGDLYRLVAGSKLPSAQRFESWVFDELLPTIRRTGGYQVPTAPQPVLNVDVRELVDLGQRFATAVLAMTTALAKMEPAVEENVETSHVLELEPAVEIEPEQLADNDIYYSIADYTKLRGLNIGHALKGGLGSKAARLSRRQGLEIDKVYHPSRGALQVYRADILRDTFKGI